MGLNKTQIINIKKVKVYDFNIMRPTMWGNVFSDNAMSLAEKIVGSRYESIVAYSDWLLGKGYKDFMQEERFLILDNLYRLKGKVLGCGCHPRLCHGDVLVQLIDQGINRNNLEQAVIKIGVDKKDKMEDVKLKMKPLF